MVDDDEDDEAEPEPKLSALFFKDLKSFFRIAVFLIIAVWVLFVWLPNTNLGHVIGNWVYAHAEKLSGWVDHAWAKIVWLVSPAGK